MSTDEYVPEERDFIDSWACAHVTPLDMTSDEAKDAARAFLARVRRDAAREALDGLAAEAREGIVNRETTWGHGQSIASAAGTYRDTHYPEETP